jgi:hypothetical protein
MGDTDLTPEKRAEYERIIDAVAQYGSLQAAARAHNQPRATWQYRYEIALVKLGRRDVRSPLVTKTGPLERPTTDSVKVSGDACEITKDVHERVRSLADLVRVCEIDTSEWEVERYICNKWEMAAKLGPQDTASMQVTPLYQVKAWLRRKVAVIAARLEIESLLADAKQKVAKRAAVAKRKGGSHMLEIAIPDLHIGKLAWAAETGHESYDSRIAERLFDKALEVLIDRTSRFDFELVVLPIGNDLLHSDTKRGTTTAGTPLDMDSRFQKSFVIARRMMTRAIDRLRQVAPVKAVIVPGNHDTLSSWCLGDSLECRFHNTPDVEIDNAPTMRKYVQFGRCMILYTHGDKGKRQDYPLLMATEMPEMFGATLHREAHTADKHTTRNEEFHGVRVRISPALCPPDAWHSEMQFVGNARSAEAYVWHRDEGMVSTSIYTVQPGDEKPSRHVA